jgi:hypothetical protein
MALFSFGLIVIKDGASNYELQSLHLVLATFAVHLGLEFLFSYVHKAMALSTVC